MKTKMMTATLLLAALPLAAQADPATDKALQLNQEPLSTIETAASAPKADDRQRLDGGSDAMAKARLRLQDHRVKTDFASSDDDYRLAREATS
ncbi:hypothetical protein BOX17_08175 [Halomonas aestuarii]|uniref:DUF4148 domain-containing protein n=1 Tax=Halomonas aestuarii TaxID=1897729 RepID=A0A1J0VFW5_9GAMM|nr:hypothetical protein [Halomonas aestuarii]APE30932.1 hypothetical protein BOX17_08175 [Halomonas aestuarii]